MTATVITILVKDGNCVDWMDLDLPTPSDVRYVNRYSAEYWQDGSTPYKLTYTIDGFFGTKDSKRYLHDISARIAYALDGSYEVNQTEIKTESKYKLSRFTHLDRPPSFNRQVEINAMGGSRNEIFDALRYKAYHMHRTNTLNLEALTVYGNLITNGSRHIKALAPNVFKWVTDNYTGRQSTMTRSEAALNASSIKAKNMCDRIFSMLRTDLFTFSSLSDAARKLSISRITFKKYLLIFNSLQQALESYSNALTPYVQLVYTGVASVLKALGKQVNWYTEEEYLTLVAVGHIDLNTVPIHNRHQKENK